jgi:GTP cyclohydrolase I
MKQNGTVQPITSTRTIEVSIDEMGDEHVSTSVDTPLRADAFDLNDEEKIEKIALQTA